MKRALSVFGYVLCIVPPALATLEFFPLWLTDGEKSISALSLLLLCISAVPLFRAYRRHVKTPSAILLWLALFLLMTAFRSIVNEIRCVALVGLVSSLPGTLCIFFAKRIKDKT